MIHELTGPPMEGGVNGKAARAIEDKDALEKGEVS